MLRKKLKGRLRTRLIHRWNCNSASTALSLRNRLLLQPIYPTPLPLILPSLQSPFLCYPRIFSKFSFIRPFHLLFGFKITLLAPSRPPHLYRGAHPRYKRGPGCNCFVIKLVIFIIRHCLDSVCLFTSPHPITVSRSHVTCVDKRLIHTPSCPLPHRNP